jgi:hypothetical protein
VSKSNDSPTHSVNATLSSKAQSPSVSKISWALHSIAQISKKRRKKSQLRIKKPRKFVNLFNVAAFSQQKTFKFTFLSFILPSLQLSLTLHRCLLPEIKLKETSKFAFFHFCAKNSVGELFQI